TSPPETLAIFIPASGRCPGAGTGCSSYPIRQPPQFRGEDRKINIHIHRIYTMGQATSQPRRCRLAYSTLPLEVAECRGVGWRESCEEACRMKHDAQWQVELRDVTAGLWVWRVEHPTWKPNQGWEPVMASTCVESGGHVLVLDPLVPPA